MGFGISDGRCEGGWGGKGLENEKGIGMMDMAHLFYEYNGFMGGGINSFLID